ncbi:hypothetical protein [Streptomyces sp. NBRC 110465]|uniref:hypothetical protein n=1 Tax=Streptomyces sp. NBRC 110465 TaxID=1897621 RepID=UPI0009340F8E|nr:hypothetical protein [Streptomyces sp. NBRC 110465]
MDFEGRVHRNFAGALAAGGLTGIAAGALVAWLLGTGFPGSGGVWVCTGGGLLGVLIAAALGWRAVKDV